MGIRQASRARPRPRALCEHVRRREPRLHRAQHGAVELRLRPGDRQRPFRRHQRQPAACGICVGDLHPLQHAHLRAIAVRIALALDLRHRDRRARDPDPVGGFAHVRAFGGRRPHRILPIPTRQRHASRGGGRAQPRTGRNDLRREPPGHRPLHLRRQHATRGLAWASRGVLLGAVARRDGIALGWRRLRQRIELSHHARAHGHLRSDSARDLRLVDLCPRSSHALDPPPRRRPSPPRRPGLRLDRDHSRRLDLRGLLPRNHLVAGHLHLLDGRARRLPHRTGCQSACGGR